LVAAPHQYGFARNLIGEIHEAQLLSHIETLRHNGKAPFRANVDRITFRVQVLAPIGPLDRHSHT
jgi:hypothetical protein